MKRNNLLIPKWKNRTYNIHKQHFQMYKDKHFRMAFLGDSMMERWLSTGQKYWSGSFSDCANLGVGGDGIEHLLYRLTPNEEFKGILDVISVDKIILMIGTNNLEKELATNILAGIVNVINIIFAKQSNVELTVYGLLDRTDISLDKIADLNTKLENYIIKQNNHKLSYRFFGEKVNHDDKFFDDNVHLSELGYAKWYENLKELLKF